MATPPTWRSNQTLVRSINTSVVALLPVASILVVGTAFIGPGTLVDLAAALFIGIAVGTFSSIFIATPLLVHLRENEEEVKALEKSVSRRATRHPDTASAAEPPAEDGAQPGAAVRSTASSAPSGEGSGRQVHPYAQRGPRNQPKRPPKSRR